MCPWPEVTSNATALSRMRFRWTATTGSYVDGNLRNMPARIGNPSRRRRHFIREWREARGFSQEHLADLIGATKASISRIENLQNGYTQDFLEACADALGTHPSILLMRGPMPSELRAVAPMTAAKATERRRVKG